jgi:RarD protein
MGATTYLLAQLAKIAPIGSFITPRFMVGHSHDCVMTVLRQWRRVITLLKNRKTSWAVTACAFLISTNWLVFIWAISVDRTLETSLGYFINPLLNVLVGAFVLRERLFPTAGRRPLRSLLRCFIRYFWPPAIYRGLL